MSSQWLLEWPLDVVVDVIDTVDDAIVSAVKVYCSIGTNVLLSTNVSVLVSTLPFQRLCATTDGVGELLCDVSTRQMKKGEK